METKVKIKIENGKPVLKKADDALTVIVELDKANILLQHASVRIFNYWSSLDIQAMARDLQVNLSDDDIHAIIDELVRNWDANIGMCLMDVEEAILNQVRED